MSIPSFFIREFTTDPILFLCDHASNRVPDCVGNGSLGLPESDMGRHIAFDIGVKGTTTRLAAKMGGTTIFSNFSRLVIDPNRAEDDPTLLMRLYDGTLIPQNRHADTTEIERRLEAFHRPYHNAITATLDRFEASATPIIVSVHSFTPQLRGRAKRPWHIGVLSAEDRRLADPLIARLEAEPDICVGDNEPYVGKLEGDCMARHGIDRGLPHVLIEIRNDLIETEMGQSEWAGILAPILSDVFSEFKSR